MISAQQQTLRRLSAECRSQHSDGCSSVVLELIDVRLQLLCSGPATEVELQHFPGALGRLLSGPQADEQAGDEAQIDLDGDAILAGGQQMLAAEDAFEPAEEQLDGPAVTVAEGDKFGVQIEAIGRQQQDDGVAVLVGRVNFDDSQRLPKDGTAFCAAQ